MQEQMASLREQIEVWGELADRLTDGGKPRKKEELLRDVEWITSLVQAREIIVDSHGDVMGNLAQCIISERIATESVMVCSTQAGGARGPPGLPGLANQDPHSISTQCSFAGGS